MNPNPKALSATNPALSSPKHVKMALTTLIQHNLVTYANCLEKGRSITYYEADLEMVSLMERLSLKKW